MRVEIPYERRLVNKLMGECQLELSKFFHS